MRFLLSLLCLSAGVLTDPCVALSLQRNVNALDQSLALVDHSSSSHSRSALFSRLSSAIATHVSGDDDVPMEEEKFYKICPTYTFLAKPPECKSVGFEMKQSGLAPYPKENNLYDERQNKILKNQWTYVTAAATKSQGIIDQCGSLQGTLYLTYQTLKTLSFHASFNFVYASNVANKPAACGQAVKLHQTSHRLAQWKGTIRFTTATVLTLTKDDLILLLREADFIRAGVTLKQIWDLNPYQPSPLPNVFQGYIYNSYFNCATVMAHWISKIMTQPIAPMSANVFNSNGLLQRIAINLICVVSRSKMGAYVGWDDFITAIRTHITNDRQKQGFEAWLGQTEFVPVKQTDTKIDTQTGQQMAKTRKINSILRLHVDKKVWEKVSKPDLNNPATKQYMEKTFTCPFYFNINAYADEIKMYYSPQTEAAVLKAMGKQ